MEEIAVLKRQPKLCDIANTILEVFVSITSDTEESFEA